MKDIYFIRQINFPARDREKLQDMISLLEDTIEAEIFWPKEHMICDIYNSSGERTNKQCVYLRFKLSDEDLESLKKSLTEREKDVKV